MPGFGSNARLSITKQNSFGNSAPSSWYLVPFASHDLNYEFAELEDDNIQSTADQPDRITGIAGITGTINANIQPLIFGHFLAGVFGNYSVATSGAVYTHTFNPQTATFDASNCTIPPYSFQVDQGETGVNTAYKLVDCFLNSLDIDLAAGGFAKMSVGVLGKSASLMAKAAPPAWSTGIKPLAWSSASISIGGVANTKFQSIKVGFDNSIGVQDRIAGVKEYISFFRDGFRRFGDFSGIMDISQIDWLKVKDETEFAVVITIAGAMGIQSGYNETLKIDIPRVVYTAHPLGVSGPGIVTVNIAGRAMYHAGSGTVCTVTLINTFASY